MDKNNNNIDDNVERKIEIILAFLGVFTGIGGIFLDLLAGTPAVTLIVISFALYQGTTLAKILKKIM